MKAVAAFGIDTNVCGPGNGLISSYFSSYSYNSTYCWKVDCDLKASAY